MIESVKGPTRSPASTALLLKGIDSVIDLDGILYTGYPVVGLQTASAIDGLLITREKGMVIFDIVEDSIPSDRSNIRDELFNALHSRLISNKELAARRGVLKIKLHVFTFAPAWPTHQTYPETIYTIQSLIDHLHALESAGITNEDYRKLQAELQAITQLRPKIARSISHPDSKGSILNDAEKSIANLDKQQSKAVIETSFGIQRIRGLAGSGKTIVLALKVAYLHASNPDWNIAVTFYTRALKNQFTEFIAKFCIEHKRQEPDWNKIKILQAWGGPRDSGIYYEFCRANNCEYLNFMDAKSKFPEGVDLLDAICKEAMANCKATSEIYDVILVDEAQDFNESFLKMCYLLLKKNDKRNPYNKMLIYAYDELQKLSDSKRLGNPKDIFGSNIDFPGEWNKPKQDIILNVCYRNSKAVLVTAHALGFGIYSKIGLVTMFKDKEIWSEIGYKSTSGDIEFGKEVILERDDESSPDFLANRVPIDNLLFFKTFISDTEQNQWIAERIIHHIKSDDLSHRDIIVIHPNPSKAKFETGGIRSILLQNGINSHLAGVSSSPDNFFINDSVAFTSIYRAKGNEAAMVYIMNSEYCYNGLELIKLRNTLFTAITRSKGWVRACGIGPSMEKLSAEFEAVKQSGFKLKFRYPTEAEMKELNIIHRDRSPEEKASILESNRDFKSVVEKLRSGEIKKQDLSNDDIELFKGLIE